MAFTYAHMADLHLGSWRDPAMRELSTKVFLQALEQCLSRQVSFILFSGDIFNTSLPSLDILKIVAKKLRELRELHLPVYVIPGSHDFSPSGKTMIDVLENAGLLRNVCKGTVMPDSGQLQLQFTADPKTGAKITGILGKKGQLDRIYYENLSVAELEQEPGYKIFLFHTTLSEMKPRHLQEIESQPASFLPKGFNYYAGGHIHHPTSIHLEGYGTLTYPGALFPNNFAEVEKYGHGGYYLVTVRETGPKEANKVNEAGETNGSAEQASAGYSQVIEWVPVKVIGHYGLQIDCAGKTTEEVNRELYARFKQPGSETHEIAGKLVTIRLYGRLAGGRISDLDFKGLFKFLEGLGAHFIMKNTAQVTSPEFEEINLPPASPEILEDDIIREHLQQSGLLAPERELHLVRTLLTALNCSRKEGETLADFHQKVEKEVDALLGLAGNSKTS